MTFPAALGVAVGDRLVRRKLVWIVDEVSRKPDFSLNATVPGEETGPWRVLLRREDRPGTRDWVEVGALNARGFRAEPTTGGT